jgi:hypothetical protein
MERVEISRKRFTENPETCFNMIENGTQIVLKWGKKRIVMTAENDDDDDDDDNYFTDSMIRRIKHSEQQSIDGQIKNIHNKEELKTLLGL